MGRKSYYPLYNQGVVISYFCKFSLRLSKRHNLSVRTYIKLFYETILGNSGLDNYFKCNLDKGSKVITMLTI